MSKKVVFVMGSPHKNGNVSYALRSILNGADNAGNICSQYSLTELDIKNCVGCRRCVDNNGICVLNDDMKNIFEDIKNCDILIIGSPIYICQVNGFVKTFLDRLYPMTDKHHKPRFGNKKLIMLYTYGAPIPLIFNKYINYTGKSLKAMGLLISKNIIIHGCTTIEKVKNNNKLLKKLFDLGKRL